MPLLQGKGSAWQAARELMYLLYCSCNLGCKGELQVGSCGRGMREGLFPYLLPRAQTLLVTSLLQHLLFGCESEKKPSCCASFHSALLLPLMYSPTTDRWAVGIKLNKYGLCLPVLLPRLVGASLVAAASHSSMPWSWSTAGISSLLFGERTQLFDQYRLVVLNHFGWQFSNSGRTGCTGTIMGEGWKRSKLYRDILFDFSKQTITRKAEIWIAIPIVKFPLQKVEL